MNSYYDNVKSPTGRQVSILDVVELIPYGKKNAVSVTSIAEMLDVSDHLTQVYVRQIIRQAIEEGCLIGSCSQGYFKISNYDEFHEYINSLQTRIRGIQSRISKLSKNWFEYFNKYPEVNQIKMNL